MAAQATPSRDYDLPNEAEVLQVLRQYDVKRAQLFGSAARGELRPDSDIDLLIECNGPLDYVNILYISEAIERITGRSADVIVGLRPELWPYVEPDLVDLPL